MNAGIHIKPKKYAATFFTYIDPNTMIVDDGLTQHSGCPVFEGEKRIVTQWIRLGVDKENPWDSFDTCEFVMLYSSIVLICHPDLIFFDSQWASSIQFPRTSRLFKVKSILIVRIKTANKVI